MKKGFENTVFFKDNIRARPENVFDGKNGTKWHIFIKKKYIFIRDPFRALKGPTYPKQGSQEKDFSDTVMFRGPTVVK